MSVLNNAYIAMHICKLLKTYTVDQLVTYGSVCKICNKFCIFMTNNNNIYVYVCYLIKTIIHYTSIFVT